jgi:hypothetical protein
MVTMLTRQLLGILTAVLASVTTVGAADLSSIKRVLKKGPHYRSNTPRYCLLVFGLEAETRVWLVLDGDRLYIDRNGNGDLTEEGECMDKKPTLYDGKLSVDFAIGDVTAADGKTVYRGRALQEIMEDGAPMAFIFARSSSGKRLYTGRDASGRLRFAATPQQAPIVHIGGPLSMGLATQHRSVPIQFRCGEETELFASVGTPGVGAGSFLGLRHFEVPEEKQPVAAIEFPNRSGGPPIKVRLDLNGLC